MAFGTGSFSAKKRFRRGPLLIAQQVRKQRRSSNRLARRNIASMGFLGIERKFYDTTLVASAVTAPTDATGGEHDPSATSMITTPTQGDGEQQRDGKQIACLYVEIVGTVACPAFEASADLPNSTAVFVAIVLDTQTNAAQMNSEDCFKNLGANAGLAPNPLRNLLFGKRFRVLRQKVFEFNQQAITQQAANDYSWGGLRRNFRWYIPLKGLKINFNSGTTASVANVVDNSVHVIAFANSTTQVPTISYNARLRFLG